MGIADLPHATHGFLLLQPIYGRLDSGVGRARLRKILLNLPNGCFPTGPEGLQDLKFELT
jgi:hypothetical protein